MNGSWKVTTDPSEVRHWAEARDAVPEVVEDLEAGSDEPVLRLNFPGKQDDVFLGDNTEERPLSWDEFSEIFHDEKLAFIYDPDIVGEDLSMSYRFIKKDAIDEENPDRDPTLL